MCYLMKEFAKTSKKLVKLQLTLFLITYPYIIENKNVKLILTNSRTKNADRHVASLFPNHILCNRLRKSIGVWPLS